MPNIELLNDQITYIPIVTRDTAGNIVPAATGDVDAVTSSNATSLAMTIGTLPTASGAYAAGAVALVLTPMVQASTDIAATLTDSAGLPMTTPYVFDIVADLTPATVGLDTTVMETATQPVPTNPGP